MSKLGLMVGLPRSGKTTWAQALREKNGWTVLNPDQIRLQLTGSWFRREAEDQVLATTFLAARALLGSYNDVLIDATSITSNYREKWVRVAQEFEIPIYAFSVHASAETCRQRALMTGRSDLLEVIDTMSTLYETVEPQEGFAAITHRNT